MPYRYSLDMDLKQLVQDLLAASWLIKDEQKFPESLLEKISRFCRNEMDRVVWFNAQAGIANRHTGRPINSPTANPRYQDAARIVQLVAEEMERRQGTKDADGVGSTAQQALILHYMINHLLEARRGDFTNTAFIDFARFLTGKHKQNIKTAYAGRERPRLADLQAIRPYFQMLGLTVILEAIDNEINKVKSKRK